MIMSGNNKFTCYFCNRTIVDENPQGHTTTCASVLEPCEFKCGSYIERRNKAKHRKVCQNNTANRRSWTSTDFNVAAPATNGATKPLQTAETLPRNYRSSNSTQPTYDIQLREKLQNVERTLQELTMRYNKVSVDIYKTQQSTESRLKSDVEKLTYQYQSLQEWRSVTYNQIESIQNELATFNILKQNNDVTVHNMQGAINQITALNSVVSTMRVTFKDEQIVMREAQNNFDARLNEFKDLHSQENAVVASLWHDQKEMVDKLQRNHNDMEEVVGGFKEELNSLRFEFRTANELSAECLQFLKKQAKEVEELKKTLVQTKLDIELAEDQMSMVQGLVSSTPGRLIWKLTDFAMKFESAQSTKAPLKGPVFYTSDYGYRVRILVYLNGLRKWKGRHALICLHVIKGEYDILQKWPCKIEGNITLRDCENLDNPKDYTRYVSAKRDMPDDELEEPQESSTEYIFIPHSTLMKSSYLKEDTVFIEVNTNAKKQRNETHI